LPRLPEHTATETAIPITSSKLKRLVTYKDKDDIDYIDTGLNAMPADTIV